MEPASSAAIRICSYGGIVIGDGGRIAMIRNRNGNGAWLFPKGKAEPGETPEQAARREILEETGLSDLELLDDLGTYERYSISRTGADIERELKTIHMFLFSAPPGAELSPSMEIAEARWVPLSQVGAVNGSDKDRIWFASKLARIREAVQRD